MIEINKDGFYYVDKEGRVLIENHEILSFLKEPVFEVADNFLVRDFVNLFKKYDSLLAINPDFTEAFECLEQYEHFTKKEFNHVSMGIESEIKALEDEQYARLFISIQAIYKVSEEFICCFPAVSLAFKHIVNSTLKISSKFHLALELEQTEFRSHIPFNISQFTLFDFVASISSVIVATVLRDDVEDEFSTKELMKLKETIEREMGIHKEEEIDVEAKTNEETNKVLNDISNLLNKKNKD